MPHPDVVRLHLHLDLPEGAVLLPVGGDVGDVVLAPQLGIDGLEGVRQVVAGMGKEDGSAGALRQFFQGVVALGVLARSEPGGADGVDGGFGQEGHSERLVEGVDAGQVRSVREDQDRLAAVFLQHLLLRDEVDGVVEGGAAARPQVVDLGQQSVGIGGEVVQQCHAGVELQEQRLVRGPHDVEQEVGGHLLLETQLEPDAGAGVHADGDGQGQVGLGREVGDPLAASVFLHDEVLRREVGDEPAGILVVDRHQDIHRLHLDPERFQRIVSGPAARLGQQAGNQRQDDQSPYEEFSLGHSPAHYSKTAKTASSSGGRELS